MRFFFPKPQNTIRSNMTKSVTPRLIAQPIEKKIRFDREITEFEIQTIFSASVMTFSMVMLATKRGEAGVYLPLITSILGYWIPSPKKDNK